MGTKYLYGASVQGIQNFIFQTNKLKEIVGASEIVNKVCTVLFKDDFDKKNESIINAAGKIICLFSSAEDCERAVLNFPKTVQIEAPGLTISQSVVKLESESDFEKALKKLEANLKTQRNRASSPILSLGYSVMQRNRRTGLPIDGEENDLMDKGSRVKDEASQIKKVLLEKCFGNKFKLDNIKPIFEVDKMATKNNWLAVIHADGNGLGLVVQKVAKDKDLYARFSKNLDKATIEAAQLAYVDIKDNFEKEIPIRPILLGGDDFTVICRADFAVEYAEAFMRHFEKKTKEHLAKILKESGLDYDYLTACAGIAFIKSSYPFHYGYSLSEELCKEAKKESKKLNDKLSPSSLHFHKVQDSFVEKYDDIVKRELTPFEGYSFLNGPYYISDKQGSSVKELLSEIDNFKSVDGNAIKSHLRQWLTLLHSNKDMATQKINRLLDINNSKSIRNDKIRKWTNFDEKKTPIYDILSLLSVKYQQTK